MSAEPTLRRRRPGPFLRLFLTFPKLIYYGPIAELLRSRCVMLITTRGRRTGLLRTNGVSFMPLDEHYVVFSGWGVTSQWYRNVRANRSVRIKVGSRRMNATARLVEDPDRRVELMRRMAARSSGCGPPSFARPLLKLTHAFDYQNEIDMAVAAGSALPVVEIFPSSASVSREDSF
jgi:deazaflavin-dependent oxidoreductase (nitroreductase family)